MKNIVYIAGIFIGFLVVVAVVSRASSTTYGLKCVISSKDGNTYCVRDRKYVKRAANLLATTVATMTALVEYVKSTHPHDQRTKQLVARYNPTVVQETLPTSTLTAYTENKGEKMAFCLNRSPHEQGLIDQNTLQFVAFHELSHLATNSIGHKREFWENFKWVLENAKAAGLYQPVNYKKNPREYCGIEINDNPYYDLS
jgi:hypothetical protein